MGDVIPFKTQRESNKEKKNIVAILAVAAGSVALGIAGTIGVKDVLHKRAVAEGNKKLEPYIYPTLVDIGTMAVKYRRAHPKSVKVEEYGDWGEPTITINTKNGKLDVGMNRVQGNLEPLTTDGVEVNLRRPDVQSLAGDAGFEYLFLNHENGQWRANGQIYVNPDRDSVAFLEVSAGNPNLMNTIAIDQKAREMSRQVLGLEEPPHK